MHVDEVELDLLKLHMTTSQEAYDDSLDDTLEKWLGLGLNKFIVYFEKQWLEGHFTKWQIFQTPPGD